MAGEKGAKGQRKGPDAVRAEGTKQMISLGKLNLRTLRQNGEVSQPLQSTFLPNHHTNIEGLLFSVLNL
jgi:hypothetical protein